MSISLGPGEKFVAEIGHTQGVVTETDNDGRPGFWYTYPKFGASLLPATSEGAFDTILNILEGAYDANMEYAGAYHADLPTDDDRSRLQVGSLLEIRRCAVERYGYVATKDVITMVTDEVISGDEIETFPERMCEGLIGILTPHEEELHIEESAELKDRIANMEHIQLGIPFLLFSDGLQRYGNGYETPKRCIVGHEAYNPIYFETKLSYNESNGQPSEHEEYAQRPITVFPLTHPTDVVQRDQHGRLELWVGAEHTLPVDLHDLKVMLEIDGQKLVGLRDEDHYSTSQGVWPLDFHTFYAAPADGNIDALLKLIQMDKACTIRLPFEHPRMTEIQATFFV